MNEWSVSQLKGNDIFICPLIGIIFLSFGSIYMMLHFFKVPPQKIWIYRKNLLARWFINAELRHVAEDKHYRFWAKGAGVMALCFGVIAMIGCVINLINYLNHLIH